MTQSLAGKVASVTGGFRGIGAAIARRLSQDGVAVAFTYANSPDRAEALGGTHRVRRRRGCAEGRQRRFGRDPRG